MGPSTALPHGLLYDNAYCRTLRCEDRGINFISCPDEKAFMQVYLTGTSRVSRRSRV